MKHPLLTDWDKTLVLSKTRNCYQSRKEILFFLPNKIKYRFSLSGSILVSGTRGYLIKDSKFTNDDNLIKMVGFQRRPPAELLFLSVEHGRWSLKCTTSEIERCNSLCLCHLVQSPRHVPSRLTALCTDLRLEPQMYIKPFSKIILIHTR